MNYNEFICKVDEIKERNPILFQLEHDKTVGEAVITKYEQYYNLTFPVSYKRIMQEIGGGFFGYVIIFSLDEGGMFNLKDNVSLKMIQETGMLPVIDLETGDYIGFDIVEKRCTEDVVLWLHEEKAKKRMDISFYEVLIEKGLQN